MNVPNKLTLSRLLITPFAFFMFVLSANTYSPIENACIKTVLSILTLLLVIYMEISDLIDGKIARKHNLVTDLGKVFDPFSDMFMHLSLFFAFVLSSYMSMIVFAVCLWRELIMLLMRNLLSSRSVSFPANIFGKSKTMIFAIITFLTLILNILLNYTTIINICPCCHIYNKNLLPIKKANYISSLLIIPTYIFNYYLRDLLVGLPFLVIPSSTFLVGTF